MAMYVWLVRDNYEYKKTNKEKIKVNGHEGLLQTLQLSLGL